MQEDNVEAQNTEISKIKTKYISLRKLCMTKGINKNRVTFILVLIYFFMLMLYINEPFFESDEGDIYMVGSAIADGRMLYSEITSQHMPVMYYIAAMFAFLGASTVTGFRICFYLLMASLWGLIYYRYCSKTVKEAVALYPIIYIIILKYIDMGHAVLSEQFQGIGMAILLFELLFFARDRKLEAGDMAMISLAIFISFGSAFVAAFAIFFVALTVILMELQRYHKMGMRLADAFHMLLVSYWKLVVAILFPFAILVLYYLCTRTFDEFIDWAYVINRTVYPKYNSYGGSIINSMFCGAKHFYGTFLGAVTNFSLKNIIYTSSILGAIVFLLLLYKASKNVILALGLYFFMVGTATRGVFSFHGTPAVAVLSVMDAYVLVSLGIKIKENKLVISVVTCLLTILALPYLGLLKDINPAMTINKLKVDEGSIPYILDLITEDGEVVGFNTLQTSLIFQSNVVPSKLNAACPWIWEFGGEQDFQEYINNPPRIIIYDPGYSTWGYSIVEYAEPLYEFVKENYKPLSLFGLDSIYVCNSYYEDVLNLIDQDFLNRTGHKFYRVTSHVDKEAGLIHLQIENAENYEDIQFATWTELNGQDDLQWYRGELSDNIWSYTIDVQNHDPIGTFFIHIYSLENSDAKMLAARTIVID